MLKPPDQPYSPESGSTLAEIKGTATLEEAQQHDEEVTEARGGSGEPLEHAKDFGDSLEDEEIEQAYREYAHSQRRVSPEFARYNQSVRPAGEIDNLAYEYTQQQFDSGDRRLDWEVKIEFYKRVYPGLGPFLDSRVAKPDEDPSQGLNEFLLGADLD